MNNQIKNVFFILLFGMAPAFAENNYRFAYQNEPINPACVAMFNSSAADYPYIRSINLNECQHSNAASQETLKNKDGSYYFCNKEDDCYRYKVAGKSKNGIYVLETHSWSNRGTVVFSDLLLIRLVKTHEYVYGGRKSPTSQLNINQITEMQLLGYVNGGDRCAGDFINVQVVGNQLNIKQYNNNTSYDCTKIKKYSINLENLVAKNSLRDVIIGKGNLDEKGVYANKDFKKGEIVIQYNLKQLTKKQYEKLSEHEKMFTHIHWGVIYLYSEPERYVNHSNHPNTYQDLINKRDIALRDIKKGEMITGDATKDDIY